MKRILKRIFKSWWTISIGSVLFSILLLTVGLPIFVSGLRPMMIRIMIGVLFVSLWLLWFFLRRRRAKKAEAKLAAALAPPDRTGEEADAIRQRMKEALSNLREASGGSRTYLYSRPWYVIIGPPGAGKTTALINSGLRFPFSDQSLEGSGGTRNLDFLFSDEAVLVDTAGRYTTQDSDTEVDRQGWKSLLEMLRKNRPFEPINGIFVAIPVDELQSGDVKKIDEHAATVRRRLHEIRSELKTELPVYLLLTKADLLAGFVEYFADLDVDGRRAVFGHTFDIKDAPVDTNKAVAAFDQLTNDIAARNPKRLQEESNLRRRGLILGFPSQLHALRAPLYRFIEGAFLTENRPSGRLRGFYLSSGMQDGSSLDRIIDSVSQAYDLDQQQGQGSSRAYFLNKLLTEVVFNEAGLPVTDAKLQKKRKKQLVGAIAGIGVLAALLVVAWGVSFTGNRAFQKEAGEAAIEARNSLQTSRLDLVRVGSSDATLEQVLPLLNQLRDLPEGYAARAAGGPSISRRFGLFRSGLSRRNKEAYHNGLRRILLPRIMFRLEEQINRNMDDPVALYEPLKVYLMLGGASPDGKIDAEIVKNYIEADWASEQFAGSEMRLMRTDMGKHLDAMTRDKNLLSAWENRAAPLDANLVEDARVGLQQLSLAQLAYAIMKLKATNLDEDWHIETVLQASDAKAFANPEEVMNLSVPYFFTRDGFSKGYTIRMAQATDGLKEELWVLGENEENARVEREISNIRTGISGFYMTDYINYWENVVNAMQPGDYFNDPSAYRAFNKAPSPLKKVLAEVRFHTMFEDGAADALGDLAMTRAKRNRTISNASRVRDATTTRGLSADAQIANHFREINAWVGDGVEPAEIDDFVALVGDSMQQVLAARGPGGNNSLGPAMAPLQKAALEVPELAGGFVGGVAAGGNKTQVAVLQGEVSNYYREQILPICMKATDGRYPFTASSTNDASLRDVRTAFGDGGRMTMFIDDKLAPYMKNTGRFWYWKKDDPVTRGFSASSANEFGKAALLQDALLDGLQLEFALTEAGPGVSKVEFSTGGANLQFDPSSQQPQPIVWTMGGGVVRATDVKIFGEAGGNEEIIQQFSDRGPWSLFRALDKATIRNLGEGAVTAKFGNGANAVTFSIRFPKDQNPFSANGLWSIKCPSKL
ncbi:MAG: type VI secretion system membrane subunit TssM [Hellea sp.]|nr:type VI secretion system membrane subunit TssM [Hellea sp.]